MQKLDWKKLFSILKERLAGAEVTHTSVLIAYYLLLSIFPLLIAVGNLLPILGVDPTNAVEYMRAIVPAAVLPVLEPIVLSLLTGASGGLLSISVIGAIWSASRGINFLQKGMNKAYGIPKAGNFVTKRIVSIITILLIILLLVAFVLVFALGEMLLETLFPGISWAGNLLAWVKGLKWPVALLFLFVLLWLVYCVTPDVKVRPRDVLPGTVLGTVCTLALVQGFTFYVQATARSFSSYGALSTFFVLMFWLNFTAISVLLGAVLNATIAEYRYGPAEESLTGVDTVVAKTRDGLLKRARTFWKNRQHKQT
ncbi:YihY/virulence factor BrkB family protein [Ruminococcaceae bacterium OttesenSCG-928-O06]|nr:YihY/virulence factor BrkB family protein [Ruminococcaceae bacterium OttesenSCG-928-O06]